MKPETYPYNSFHLIGDMFETISMIETFDRAIFLKWLPFINRQTQLVITGEGSSRIFPAHNLMHHNLLLERPLQITTDGATQLRTYPLKDAVLIGTSNSGRTKELIELFQQKPDNKKLGLTFHSGTPLESVSDSTIVIQNAIETSIPATKSVIAQALIYDLILAELLNYPFGLQQLAKDIKTVLETDPNQEFKNILAKADILYFSGFNTGVAEELRLKTNEICHKKSDYLPGTYLLHGIEEVVTENDAIILVDVPENDIDKIRTHFSHGIGTPVIAISSTPTPFLTFPIPTGNPLTESYLKLVAGWNLLAEAGIADGINIDKPERVRKIGNEIESK